MRRKGFTLIELLVVLTIIVVLGTLLFGAISASREAAKADAQKVQNFSANKVDWVVLGEGYYDHAEYFFNAYRLTVVYFSDGRTVPMNAVVAMEYPKGSRVRVCQMRVGAGTPAEKLDDKYKIELLDAEAK